MRRRHVSIALLALALVCLAAVIRWHGERDHAAPEAVSLDSSTRSGEHAAGSRPDVLVSPLEPFSTDVRPVTDPADVPKAGTMRVRIVSADPKLAAPYLISIFADGVGAAALAEDRTFLTDDRGTVEIKDMRPGTWRLSVAESPRPRGVGIAALDLLAGAREGRALGMQVVSLVAGETKEVEILVGSQQESKGRVTGTVTGMRTDTTYSVSFLLLGSNGYQAEAPVSPDGFFDLLNCEPGYAHVEVSAQAQGEDSPRMVAWREVTVSAGSHEFVSIELPESRLVRFVFRAASTGEELDGIVLTYVGPHSKGMMNVNRRRPAAAVWNAGRYELLAICKGFAASYRALDIVGGEDVLEIEFPMEPLVPWRTALIDHHGVALASAIVVFQSLGGVELREALRPATKADEHGAIDVEFLPAGSYRVAITTQDARKLVATIELDPGAPVTVVSAD